MDKKVIKTIEDNLKKTDHGEITLVIKDSKVLDIITKNRVRL